MSKEPKTAPLTIFYAGQVIVYDDFPADKVEEIMSIARNGISQTQNPSAYAHTQTQPSVIPNIIIPGNFNQQHPHAPSAPIVSGNFFGFLLFLTQLMRIFLCYGSCFSDHKFQFYTDLPIARKASLHRFMEKRKDR